LGVLTRLHLLAHIADEPHKIILEGDIPEHRLGGSLQTG
jgi:hypothetical protein